MSLLELPRGPLAEDNSIVLGPLSKSKVEQSASRRALESMKQIPSRVLGQWGEELERYRSAAQTIGTGVATSPWQAVAAAQALGTTLARDEPSYPLAERFSRAGDTFSESFDTHLRALPGGEYAAGALEEARARGEEAGFTPGQMMAQEMVAPTPGIPVNKLKNPARLGGMKGAVKAGFKITKGRFVGAPRHVANPRHVEKQIEAYVNRIERALDDGLEPGWFYAAGERAFRNLSPDEQRARMIATSNAVASSEAPVRQNMGWAIQPFEQHAQGAPISSGLRPANTQRRFEDLLNTGDVNLGEKTGPFAGGLTGDRWGQPPRGRLAPNDRWEIRAFGYTTPKGEAMDSVGSAQHAYMHRVRQLAVDRLNARRGLNFDVYDGQELHWAVVRADAEGVSIQKSAQDSITNAIDHYTFQHSWDTPPGKEAGHLPGVDLDAHDAAVKRITLDPETGRDRIVAAFGGGGLYQKPPQHGVSVYKGDVGPYGVQSHSLVYRTDAGGLGPQSAERVKSSEKTRGVIFGQDAIAGNLTYPTKLKRVNPEHGGLMYDTPGGVSPGVPEVENLKTMLAGKGYSLGDDVGYIPTGAGGNVISTGAGGLEKHAREIGATLGAIDEPAIVGSRRGTNLYEDLPWKSRGGTGAVADLLDNYSPASLKHADSDEIRTIAGQAADYYEAQAAQGIPAIPGLTETLRAWQKGGIAAVREKIAQGIAPAVVLSLLPGAFDEQDRPSPSPGRAF